MDPALNRRAVQALGCVAYVVVTTSMLVWSGEDRWAIPTLLALAAPVATSLAVTLVAGPTVAAGLAPLSIPAGFAVAALGNDGFAPIFYGVAWSVVAGVAIPVGAVWRARLAPRLPVASLLFAAGLVLIPLSLIERSRTVRAHHLPGIGIDPVAGTYRGVGIGDRLATVKDALGPGTSYRDARAFAHDEGLTGPNSLPGWDEEHRYGTRAAFDIVDGRVTMVEIADTRAQLPQGVGPGDSLRLFERQVPALHCDEGALGSDEPSYYPYCSGRVAPHRWLWVGGTYDRPGERAVLIILSRQAVV